jgi:hypothetical protein
MSTPRLLAAALSFGALTILQAAAQAPAQTGTGGGPTSTVTAPNTSAVGRTKPPGGGRRRRHARRPRRRTPQQKEDDQIQKGICIGCNAK